MATSSSVINLYDSVSQAVHFQAKISTDKAVLQVNSTPLVLKAPSVNLLNNDGSAVTDVVKTILDTILSVSQEALDRANAVSAEAATREQADLDLQAAIDQENVDMLLAVLTEKNRAAAAELVLTNDLVSETSARQSAVTSEISARSAADSALQFNIDTESSARVSADSSLTTAIALETTNRGIAIASETALRVSGDALVQSNLTAEAATRLSQDNLLQVAVTAEQTARIAAVSAEASARSSADEILATSILTEKTRAQAEVNVERLRINSLLDGTTIDLNQLQELISAYSSADSSILTTIGNIQSTLFNIQAQLSGTDSKLNSLIEDIAITAAAAVMNEILANEYPQTSISTTSTLVKVSSRSDLASFAFNKLYGDFEETESSLGWVSQVGGGGQVGTNVIGLGVMGKHWLQIDLEGADPITKFQLYVTQAQYEPLEWIICGSNDELSFTKLYHCVSFDVFPNTKTVDNRIQKSSDLMPFSVSSSFRYLRFVHVSTVDPAVFLSNGSRIASSASGEHASSVVELRFFS